MYCSILRHLPSLKKLVLNTPSSIDENQIRYEGEPLSQVKDVTMNATPYGQFQTLLRLISSMFPNLNRLALRYFCGIWVENIGEFQVLLAQYSLERLTIDITPMKLKMSERLNENYEDVDFLVVEIEVLSESERHFYKVSVNRSSATPIEPTDLKGFILGEDYLRLRVCIRNLRCLELCMYSSSVRDDDYLHNTKLKQITRTLIHI